VTTMTSAPTAETTERATREAGKLAYGDHIIDHQLGIPAVRQVAHTEPYRDDDDVDMVVIVCRGGTVLHVDADRPVGLATDEEVAAAAAYELRAETVAALRSVADLIHGYDLPLSGLPVDVSVRLADPDAVRKLAADLGLDVREDARHVTVTLDLPQGRQWIDQRVGVRISAVADEEQPR